MYICTLISIVGAFFLGLYIVEKAKRASIKALYQKTFISICFLMLGIYATYKAGNVFGIFVVIGLVWGLLGDIWLDLKYVYPKDDYLYTMAGFECFAVGHLFYMIGLLYCYFKPHSDIILFVAVPAILAICMGFAVVLFGKIMKLNYGRFKIISMIYGVFLFGTTFFAGSLAIMYGFKNTTLNLFFIGAVLFAASDLVLSGTYFGEGKDRPIDIVVNYLTYYPGQFLIAWSVLFSTLR